MTVMHAGWNGGLPWATQQITIDGWAIGCDGFSAVAFRDRTNWVDRGHVHPRARKFFEAFVADEPKGERVFLAQLLAFAQPTPLCLSCRPTGYRWCLRCASAPGRCAFCNGERAADIACDRCGASHRCSSCPSCEGDGTCPTCSGTTFMECPDCAPPGAPRRYVRILGGVFDAVRLRLACTSPGEPGALQVQVCVHVAIKALQTEEQLRIYGAGWRAVVMSVDGVRDLTNLPRFEPLVRP